MIYPDLPIKMVIVHNLLNCQGVILILTNSYQFYQNGHPFLANSHFLKKMEL